MSVFSEEEDENGSDISSIHNGSVVSTVPDRHGFLGGSQYSPDPKQVLSASKVFERELKWVYMIKHWESFMKKHYKKVKERCQKGIPSSVRSQAWLLLCTSTENKKMYPPQYFENLCASEGNPRCVEDIKKDLHRQFPTHEFFISEDGHGQKELFNVLKAYSIKNPTVGYSQAQAPIAAFLLMHMPTEDAFWCLVNICDTYLKGYYSYGMETLQVDGDMLFAFLKRRYPDIYKHLKKQKIEPILYMTEWFLCVFTRTLPWCSLLRVWDMFLCEGVSVIFKVALILINVCLRSGAKSTSLKKQYPTMYETLEALRNPPRHLLEEDTLVKQILSIKLSRQEMDDEAHRQQLKRNNKKNSK